MAREMGFTSSSGTMQGLTGQGPGVVVSDDPSMETAKQIFGPRLVEAVSEKDRAMSMRTIVSPTLQQRSEEMRQYLEDTLIEHVESVDDWVSAIFTRAEMTGYGYHFEWATDEINSHVALPSPEGHAFHIMSNAKEKRTASLARFSIGMRAHNDDLKEPEGRDKVSRMIANIPSAVIRAERLMALAHISRVPGVVKFMLEPQGIKTYATIHDAMRDSKDMVGMLHAEKGIYRLWNEIRQYKVFDHIIVPKGVPEQIVGGSDFETEYWRTGKAAHRALANPTAQMNSGLANKPTFWVLEPMQSRDISAQFLHPLRRTLRFGEYAMIDGTHLIRAPHDTNVLNHLSVQIVDAHQDDWSTMQYLEGLRNTGRWDFKSGSDGPLRGDHYDFGPRGFATYVNNIAATASRREDSPKSNEPQAADLWGDTYFWRAGSYGGEAFPKGQSERFFMPCKRWGDQDLLYRSLEFDDQHVMRSLATFKEKLISGDYDALQGWENLSAILSSPIQSGPDFRVLEDYLLKKAKDSQLKFAQLHLEKREGASAVAQAGAAAAAAAERTDRGLFPPDFIELLNDGDEDAIAKLVAEDTFIAADWPYGFGTAWGMYMMADAARMNGIFDDYHRIPGFLRAHEIAQLAWKTVKKIFDFAMTCYPGCKKFLSDNALYWFNDGSISGPDLMTIQFWELMASDNARLPTFVHTPGAVIASDGLLESLEQFRTDEDLMAKLKFAASRIGGNFLRSSKGFFSKASAGPDQRFLSDLAKISRHSFFMPRVNHKWFIDGKPSPRASKGISDLYSDFDIKGAFGSDRSEEADSLSFDAIDEFLNRAFLSVLILDEVVNLESQLAGRSLKEFYDDYAQSAAETGASIRKKRGREDDPDSPRDPSGYEGGEEWTATQLSFSIEWWRTYEKKPARGTQIAVGLPSNPLVPLELVRASEVPEGLSIAAERERQLKSARGKPTFEIPGTKFDEQTYRAFGRALRDRERDTLPIGGARAVHTDWDELEKMSDTYHYNHILFNPDNGIFWRRDPRTDHAKSYYEVGTMTMRMQHARRQFGDSPISLAIARAFLFSEISFRSVQSIVRCNGLPPVLSLALFRAFAEIDTQAVIFANHSGLLLSKHADLMEGREVGSKVWAWHFTEWKGILQRDYTSIMIRPDLLFDGYRRGLNSNYFPAGWKLDQDHRKALSDYSIFVVDCGANFSREDMIASANPVSITGRYVPSRFSDVRLSAEESERLTNPPQPHFPGYAWLHFHNHMHLLEHGQVAMSEFNTFERLRKKASFDGLCWRGTQRVWNDHDRGFTTMIAGNGVARDWEGPGILDKFQGKKKLKF